MIGLVISRDVFRALSAELQRELLNLLGAPGAFGEASISKDEADSIYRRPRKDSGPVESSVDQARADF